MTSAKKCLRRSPAGWAAIYLLLVPAFAVVYENLPPRSLYDQNINLEESLGQAGRTTRQKLTEALYEEPAHATWTISATRVRLVPHSLAVDTIARDTRGGLLISINGQFVAVGKHPGRLEGGFAQWLHVFPETNSKIVSASGQPLREFIGVSLVNPEGEPTTPSRIAPPLSVLLQSRIRGLPLPNGTSGELSLLPSAADAVTQFVQATEGDPSYSAGRWWRMFYMSATTITTLGLGDLSPLSTKARLCVSLEALLGIVVVGLFLNALARRTLARRQGSGEGGG